MKLLLNIVFGLTGMGKQRIGGPVVIFAYFIVGMFHNNNGAACFGFITLFTSQIDCVIILRHSDIGVSGIRKGVALGNIRTVCGHINRWVLKMFQCFSVKIDSFTMSPMIHISDCFK
jgi:hypothetical protein